MKHPSALTVEEEREVARLVAGGRSAAAARQYVVEGRFRSRSQRREEGGCRRPVSDSLNSYVNSVFHGSNHPMEQDACPPNQRSEP